MAVIYWIMRFYKYDMWIYMPELLQGDLEDFCVLQMVLASELI